MENLIIIDLGSNSVRLSINEIAADGSTKEVKRLKRMSRLAEGMGQADGAKVLQPAAIERTLAALKEFKDIYQTYPNVKLKGIATAAVRSAENSQAFLAQIKALTGVTVDVLSGEREAYYDYLGVMSVLPIKDCLIMDMGGGSFELILVKNRNALNLISIPYGAVSLTEKFKMNNQIEATNLFAFQRFLQAQFNQLPWLTKGHGLPIILLGGANRTVIRYELEKDHPHQLASHQYSLAAEQFLNIYQQWLGLNCQERAALLGDEADRADIIMGGLTPLVQLVEMLGIPELIFSESGVREGILAEMQATANNG